MKSNSVEIKKILFIILMCTVLFIFNAFPVLAKESENHDSIVPARAEMCGQCWKGDLILGLRYVTTDAKSVPCSHYSNASWSDLVIVTITHQVYTCNVCGYSYEALGTQEGSPVCGKP